MEGRLDSILQDPEFIPDWETQLKLQQQQQQRQNKQQQQQKMARRQRS